MGVEPTTDTKARNLEGVLFSESGREYTVQDLIFSETIQPLFKGNKVLDPKPIVVEGTYYLYDSRKGTWRDVKITAKDLEQYYNNATRDVAVNYEHDRNDRPKGWVRLRDTKRLDVLETPDGPKMAIFAAIELMPEAAELVAQGVYRDVSIELKPVSKEITGLALTAYPVIRHLQFSDEADNDEALQEQEQVYGQEEMSMDKEVLLSEALQEFGITLEELKQLPEVLKRAKELEEQAKAAKQEALFAQTKAELVQRFSEDGGLKVAPGALDALAALYVFAEEHSELTFSLNGESKDLKTLLDEVLAGIEAVKVFGETGVGAMHTNPEPNDVDKDRVQTIVSILQRKLEIAKE